MVVTREKPAIDLLQSHDIDYGSWQKPLSCFLQELETDMVDLVSEDGVAIRESWGVWMRIICVEDFPYSSAFELYEHSRKFPPSEEFPLGLVDYRNKNPDYPRSKERGASETRKRGKSWTETCMDLLSDEAKFRNPSPTRLFRRPGGLRTITKASTAYKGLMNRMHIMSFDYQAISEETGEIHDGKTIVSLDELNIETYLVYRELHD